jgi:hypothetical protein
MVYNNPYDYLALKPSIHYLTYGTFIQHPIHFSDDVFVIPLKAMGFSHGDAYVKEYVQALTKNKVDEESFGKLQEFGVDAFPVISIIIRNKEDLLPHHFEEKTKNLFITAQKLISITSGETPECFATIVSNRNSSYFNICPPFSAKRYHVGSGYLTNISNNFDRLHELRGINESFDFCLGLYSDSLTGREPNSLFRIARLFNVLEGLACGYYKLNSGGIGSRKAIKKMLDNFEGVKYSVEYEKEIISVDYIEISGRLRDQIYHGNPISKIEIPDEYSKAYEYFYNNQEDMIRSLKSRCEIEFLKILNSSLLK